MLGDFLNLALTVLLAMALVGLPRLAFPALLFYLPIAAECIRLFAERVPTIFSAAWQLIPHRQIARTLQRRSQVHLFWLILASCLSHYCRYYAFSDTDRAAYVLQALKERAVNDPAVLQRLSYIQAFRIIQQQHGLRGGLVRDVARGEVFIHGHWTSDPCLLIGMALRRAPWPFDPRYLRRPFYYMSGVTSLFVLQSARYSLPYALFQFGHEIRVARLHFFYQTLRWLGIDIERKVWSDGTFHPDQFIFWLRKKFGHHPGLEEPRALYTDSEVIAELLMQDTLLSTPDLAERYTYPIKYVEEVLADKIVQALAFQSSHQELAKERIGL